MTTIDLRPSDATLSRADILRVLDSREGLRAVMTDLAARPRLEAEELLRVFIWLASSACGWTDGTFAVHVRPGTGPGTVRVDVVDEVGDDVYERLVPALEFRVDVAELGKILRFMRPLLEGLVAAVHEGGMLVLRRQVDAHRRETGQPPATERSEALEVGMVTRAHGLSDEFLGEISELAAKAAEPEVGDDDGR